MTREKEVVNECIGSLDHSIKRFSEQISKTIKPTIELAVRRGIQAGEENQDHRIQELEQKLDSYKDCLVLPKEAVTVENIERLLARADGCSDEEGLANPNYFNRAALSIVADLKQKGEPKT